MWNGTSLGRGWRRRWSWYLTVGQRSWRVMIGKSSIGFCNSVPGTRSKRRTKPFTLISLRFEPLVFDHRTSGWNPTSIQEKQDSHPSVGKLNQWCKIFNPRQFIFVLNVNIWRSKRIFDSSRSKWPCVWGVPLENYLRDRGREVSGWGGRRSYQRQWKGHQSTHEGSTRYFLTKKEGTEWVNGREGDGGCRVSVRGLTRDPESRERSGWGRNVPTVRLGDFLWRKLFGRYRVFRCSNNDIRKVSKYNLN